jgi:hypothetical protein
MFMNSTVIYRTLFPELPGCIQGEPDVGAAIEELVSRLQNMYCRSQSTIPHSEHTM